MIMINTTIYTLLNKQINAEIWSSYLYRSMSLFAESHGYRGISNWFYIQSHEELDHARMIEKYIMAHNHQVKLLPVVEVPCQWSSPLEMFRQALTHEQTITRKIGEIFDQSQKDRDYATCSFLSWFIDEQVEEEESCSYLIQQLEKAGDMPCYFMQIDYELQQRKYEPNEMKGHAKWYA